MCLHDLHTWSQHEVEGIAQKHLDTTVFKTIRREPLDRPIGSAGHEDRRLNFAAAAIRPRELQGTPTRFTIGTVYLER